MWARPPPGARERLILADSGGSYSARSRVWKQQLQEQLCDRHGLTVTVCHYPTGCSKWNPIEHRLFGPISQTWAGRPLATWETLLGDLQGTTTATGLTVRAARHDGVYQTGESVPDVVMATLNLTKHDLCPIWNSTLRPRSAAVPDSALDAPSRELGNSSPGQVGVMVSSRARWTGMSCWRWTRKSWST